MSKRLVIDECGARVEGNSYSYPFDQTLEVSISRLNHPRRLEIWPLRFPLPQPPPGEPELPTLESAANDVLRRQNAELRDTISRMRDVHDRLTEANTRQLRQNEGLKNDVRQAEEHYEAASKRLEILRGQMEAVSKVLDGREPLFTPEQQGPILELARKVVRQSRDRWVLYEETMARLAALGKELELTRQLPSWWGKKPI